MPIDQYAATILIGTVDADGNVLQSMPVTVTYSVFDGVKLVALSRLPSFVFGGPGDARRIVWPGNDATTTVLAISSLP